MISRSQLALLVGLHGRTIMQLYIHIIAAYADALYEFHAGYVIPYLRMTSDPLIFEFLNDL